ncbi:2Fe-2S iron-sulfur cluster-binding protein [Eoetvoesiella caeni]|uniref:2Fe-2S ferredoxin n=1 Tax=Eoetvoesiella caeni TaxID=645616 RepID=A0A366GY33_9BURK|nr:2Fe-2S iron-sulfur cluster-binding protein [Eoetvoesiella caeni]MCI2811248.1 2Fe-2S iron-sulfur cluster-binding protein [Eoetvoesiella caeni]NYT57143.1 2Fe-2S iron-sulfur cluster binding domain-containing protein [Eoetvoesiella caeni]RBP33655.1 2Fe-2S ferredoxin [Eoetvoesiella caeni]
MALISFVLADGSQHDIEAAEGTSVMEAAVAHNLPGIDADCGGACACATCHVYVASDWVERLPPRAEQEEKMLEFAIGTRKNSRLSCQLCVSAEFNGLQVEVPESQY